MAQSLTHGTLAGPILSDSVVGRSNPSAEFFDATRIRPAKGGMEFIKENLRTAQHFVGDRFLASRPKQLSLACGDAAIVKIDGEQLATFRDDAGELHTVSAICTHMGCVVGWNASDRTWDCACHGSRFGFDGTVLHGPATLSLEKKVIHREP